MRLLDKIREISEGEEKCPLSEREKVILRKKINVLVHRQSRRDILKSDITASTQTFSEWLLDKIESRPGIRTAYDNFLKVCVYIYLIKGGVMPDIMKEMKRDYENMLCWKKIDLNSMTKDLMY